MIASDPKYGFNVKPEDVIGVSTLLENPATGELTTARKMTADQGWIFVTPDDIQ